MAPKSTDATPSDVTAKNTVPESIGSIGTLIVLNGPYIVLLIVYVMIFQLVVPSLPNAQRSGFAALALALLYQTGPLLLFTLAVNRTYTVAKRRNVAHPIRAIAGEIWRFISDRKRLALGLPVLAIMIVFNYVYLEFKVNLPKLEPFAWDHAFYEMDRIVHFGRDPWQIIDPFFRLSDYLVFALSVNYQYWFLSMWVVFAIYAFARSVTVLRTRYLLAFFLTWAIGGNWLATVFSSAGPAFYSGLGLAPDPYEPLLTHLGRIHETLPLTALDLQRRLWDGYTNLDHNWGISAMPSMHNALALLSVIGAWRYGTITRWILVTHAVLIFVGSFYLAWHYAVDAYLGWAVALIMWWLAGPIARWWHRIPGVESRVKSFNAG